MIQKYLITQISLILLALDSVIENNINTDNLPCEIKEMISERLEIYKEIDQWHEYIKNHLKYNSSSNCFMDKINKTKYKLLKYEELIKFYIELDKLHSDSIFIETMKSCEIRAIEKIIKWSYENLEQPIFNKEVYEDLSLSELKNLHEKTLNEYLNNL